MGDGFKTPTEPTFQGRVKAELADLDLEKVEGDLGDLEWVLQCVDGSLEEGSPEDGQVCSRCSAESVSPVLKICLDARKMS